MLDILTPLNKCERVSRVVDPVTFVAAPGIWGEIETAGSIKNVVNSTPAKVNKMVISSVSGNVYESHDIEVGRVTCMESQGIRVKVDSEGYDGVIVQGNMLAVSDGSGVADTEGKLFDITANPDGYSGTFETVARAEEVGTDYIIFRTISPVLTTV